MSRRSLAVGAVLAAFLALPVVAGPARACGCGASMDEELARGGAVALVTRVDDGATANAVFAVEDALGHDLPARVRGTVEDECAYVVAHPGRLIAVALRPDDGWSVAGCGGVRLEQVLAKFPERRAPLSGEPPVVLAAGNYGTYGLVTLDRRGAVVARGARGAPDAIDLCPGGRRFVTFSLPLGVAVYDVADLRLRRTVPVKSTSEFEAGGLTCADADGDDVRMTLGQDGDDRYVRLTVNGSTVRTEPLVLERVFRAGDTLRLEGDTVVRYPPGDPRLDRHELEPGTTIRNVLESEDGQTVIGATVGSTGEDRPYAAFEVVRFDRRTGKVGARWVAPTYVGGLTRTASGAVLVRLSYQFGPGMPYRAGEMVRLDPDLRLLSREPTEPADGMAVSGESAVLWGGTRMSVATVAGRSLVIDDLRLAATERLVVLSQAGFDPGEERKVSLVPSTDRTSGGVLVGLALAALAAVGFALRAAQRPFRALR